VRKNKKNDITHKKGTDNLQVARSFFLCVRPASKNSHRHNASKTFCNTETSKEGILLKMTNDKFGKKAHVKSSVFGQCA